MKYIGPKLRVLMKEERTALRFRGGGAGEAVVQPVNWSNDVVRLSVTMPEASFSVVLPRLFLARASICGVKATKGPAK